MLKLFVCVACLLATTVGYAQDKLTPAQTWVRCDDIFDNPGMALLEEDSRLETIISFDIPREAVASAIRGELSAELSLVILLNAIGADDVGDVKRLLDVGFVDELPMGLEILIAVLQDRSTGQMKHLLDWYGFAPRHLYPYSRFVQSRAPALELARQFLQQAPNLLTSWHQMALYPDEVKVFDPATFSESDKNDQEFSVYRRDSGRIFH